MSTATAEHTLDVDAIRADFPILSRPLRDGRPLVYLDTAATAQKPKCVIDAIVECYETCYANPHRGIHELGDRATEAVEAVRSQVQRFIGAAEPEEVIFTSGTTMSVNLVSNAWGRKFLQPGDELLLNEMEHHANLVPWQRIAHERGAKLRFIPLTDDGRLDLSQLDDVLTERTRLLAVTSMSNVLGTINPIEELARRAKANGTLIFVDAAQSVPHMPTDVMQSGVDFLTFSGHKMYGPSGVGVLYGRRELLEQMDPFLCGGHMIYEVTRENSSWAELPAKFEAGTMAVAPVVGLGPAIDYVNQIGFEAVQLHEHRLLEETHDRLAEIPGLRILGPDVHDKGAIVSFTVDGVHAHDLADLLDRKGVAVRAGHHCTMPLHDWFDIPATTRVSLGVYNTSADIDALVDAIHFARHTFRLE